jgi:hypothetical protein
MGRFLPEHTTAASILDRLLHHATIVVTSGESYRMRHADHKKESPNRVSKPWPSPKGTVPVARLPSAHVRRRTSESLGLDQP